MYKRGRINHSDLRRHTLQSHARTPINQSASPKKSVGIKKMVSKVVRTANPVHPVLKFERFEHSNGTFKHSGDLGDLWYSLPIMRYLGGGILHLNPKGLNGFKPDGTPSGLNHNTIMMAMPLLEAQQYIYGVKFWTEETSVMVDMDEFRKINVRSDNLCNKILSAFSVPFNETNKPWISCEPKPVAKAVFARSFRYRSPKVTYKQLVKLHNKSSVFVGLPEEHRDFERQFGKIEHYNVKDFLEMAQVINGAEIFIGNQSSPMALAIAMHKPFIQEAYFKGADCRFYRPNAKYM
jgi:hypothetical protein